MLKKLLYLRYLLVIAVVFMLFNAVLTILKGAAESLEGYRRLWEEGIGNNHGSGGVLIVRGLDLFLVGMVFLIFGLGILKIFLMKDQDDSALPNWLRIHHFKELKTLLWETILVTLVVFCFTNIIGAKGNFTWTALVIPATILMLSLSLYFMKRND